MDFDDPGQHGSSDDHVSSSDENCAPSSGQVRVVISNIPDHVRLESFEESLSALTSYTPFISIEKLAPKGNADTQAVQVMYENQDQAQQVVSQVNGHEYEGNTLKADISDRRNNRPRNSRPPFSGMQTSSRQTDFPLRILVQSDMVGAIIGRQGSTIRQITQQTRARVDVHRKDNVGSVEKAITIYGNPENCTNACRRILEVMQQEATSTNKGEISLKILAHNNLIGRIIGKSGNTIKRIMQDTDTKITVSSINDINSFNLERIITVKGTIENMSKAEALISSKLRQSYENDLQAMAPQSLMFPGLHPMAMMSTVGVNYPRNSGPGGGGGNNFQGGSSGSGVYSSGPTHSGGGGGGAAGSFPPIYPGGPQTAGMGQPPVSGPNDQQETVYLYIPNNAVGAIIGTKGSHIRNIIRFSGASVKIAALEEGKPVEQQPERKVTIVGTPEAQWKAQYLIFEKMREEGFVAGTEDVRLTIELHVPSAQVGRIIGKGGQNVRELQRITGGIIKLPEQASASGEETMVHIIGPFFSVQSAQRRIRSMIQQGQPGLLPPGGPPSRGPGGGRPPLGPRGDQKQRMDGQ
ncbi:insulin-like growth factor 2 mRNA-binding protein 2 isoform X2 [Neocloeon triangulifer]|uniref:insulin-like growth factor 2 mRNA-binding protein 2 isoform X2 n=1 Tax=Neocloeon triangulifer TaxID=2078957 RepID=UPI00286F4A79|nr:insulin-like growth factor 2 mRNA-binding protein 2 isoform X2 [Neocloeon triangulifer]